MIFVYFMTTAPSFLVWGISYIWFTPKYVEDPSHIVTSRDKTNVNLDIQMDDVNETLPDTPENFSQKLCKSRLCHFNPVDVSQIEYEERKKAQEGCLGTFTYFKKGILHVYHNPVCFAGLTHAFFVCLFWKLMSGAEPLNLAASNINTNLTPTLENLCAGEFTNLFYQYAWNNVFYVAGAGLYVFTSFVYNIIL